MSDLIYLALVVAFFALAAGLVRACEHIIGDDAPATGRAVSDAAPAEPLEVVS